MLGKRIKELRKQNNLTQTELGKRLGVIKQTISSWENGISSPSNDTLAHIASIFGVSIDYLLTGNEDPSPGHSQEYAGTSNRIDMDSGRSPSESPLDESSRKFLNTFLELNEDNRDIIIGDMKKLLKEQRREEELSSRSAQRKAK